MKGKTLIIVGFAAAAVVILLLARRNGGEAPPPAGPAAAAAPAGAPPGPGRTAVTMLYGTEKRAYVQEMAAAFEREQSRFALRLTAAGSLEAAERILDGKEAPAVFSPGDSLILNLLAADWQTKHGTALLDEAGDGAPQPLVITPLVFVAWEDRARVLEKAGGGRLSWRGLHKALTAPKGWGALGGDPEWGFVKLGHTDPTRSNSGLLALFSMALEGVARPGGGGSARPLRVADLLEPKLQGFLRAIEKGVTKFETSTGNFMTDMVRFGPSKYDVAAVYESLAIEQIANAQGRWGNLRVYYPSPTIWSDHPIAVVNARKLAPEEREGALAWIRFLRGRAAQERALAFGFRPADPAVAIKSDAADNPFKRLAPFGLRVEIPPAAAAPEGAVVRNLLTLWGRLGLR